MLPNINIIPEQIIDTPVILYPSKTFKIDWDNRCISTDYITNKEALRQSIYLILRTERYRWAIFTWNYGTQLNDLFGENKDFVIPRLQGRITDALMQDDRITDVYDFSFDVGRRGRYTVSFKVANNVTDENLTISEVELN